MTQLALVIDLNVCVGCHACAIHSSAIVSDRADVSTRRKLTISICSSTAACP